MNNRRTQYEIYWEILTYCKTPRLITQVIQRCNLNTKISQEYIDFLTLKGYLVKTQEKDKTLFTTTPVTKDYMEMFMRLYMELFKNTPEFKL